MQARGKEVEIMQQLNEKAMTDEETDCDDTVLVKRTPPWRNTKLMKTLDSRKDSKSDTIPKKERRTGRPSERSPPKNLPTWALRDTCTSESYSSSLSDAFSPAPSQAISPESPMQFPAQSRGLSPISSQSSSPTPNHTSPPMRIQPSTPSRVSPICTPLSHNMRFNPGNMGSNGRDTTPSDNGDSLSDGESDDIDEMSTWIRAVTGVKVRLFKCLQPI